MVLRIGMIRIVLFVWFCLLTWCGQYYLWCYGDDEVGVVFSVLKMHVQFRNCFAISFVRVGFFFVSVSEQLFNCTHTSNSICSECERPR